MNRADRQAERFHSRGFSSNFLMAVLLFIVALVGVSWVYMGMVAHDRWPIRWLEVDGAFQRVSSERVRSKVSPMVNGSFFTVDLGAVRAQTELLPWVSSVSVQKTWPDTVRVTVREHSPLAHWIGGQLISPQGTAFSVPGAEDIQGLPWLEGPQGTVDKVFTTWQQFNDELFRIGLEIERIRLDRRGSWYLLLTNGTRVHLGRENSLARLHRMVASWPELLKLKEMAPMDVDLRYSNGFSVRWPEPPPTLAVNAG